MGKVDKSKAAKTGDILYRYMWTRHCCVGAPAPSDPIWLAYLIEWGKTKFDNIYVKPDESPPLVWDNQHPALFSAMVKMDEGTMPRPPDLAAWRTYVLYNSLPPKRPEGLGLGDRSPAALARTGAGPSLRDPIAEVWGKLQITATPRLTAPDQADAESRCNAGPRRVVPSHRGPGPFIEAAKMAGQAVASRGGLLRRLALARPSVSAGSPRARDQENAHAGTP